MVPLAVAAGILLWQRARVRTRHDPDWPRLRAAQRLLVRGRAGSRSRLWPASRSPILSSGRSMSPHSRPSLRSTTAATVIRAVGHARRAAEAPPPDDGLGLRDRRSAWLRSGSPSPSRARSSPAGVLLALPLIALLAVFARERRVRIDHELELRDAYRGTAFLLGTSIEADDAYTGEHSQGRRRSDARSRRRARAVVP